MTRRTSLLEDVMSLPWPVGVIAAAITFGIFKFLELNPPNGISGQIVVTFTRVFGWVIPGLFLLGAIFSLLTQLVRRKRFKNTRSIADIRSLSWRQFESYVGEMFRQQGYFVLETPEGPDNGVDMVLRKDGEKTYVQCKHWKTNQVGVEKVRELLGSMAAGGAQAGIFVASGSYTQAAKDLARQCGIQLIGGEELAASLKSKVSAIEPMVEPLQADTVTCPKCQSPMVRRMAKQGRNKGKEFWGCTKYPACRGIINEN